MLPKDAHEEIGNVYQEGPRLHTAIRDEEILFRSVLSKAEAANSPIRVALLERCRHRRAANARNMAYIHHLHGAKGYAGPTTPGRRAGVASSGTEVVLDLDSDPTQITDDQPSEEDVGELDDANTEVSGILEYLASLTL